MKSPKNSCTWLTSSRTSTSARSWSRRSSSRFVKTALQAGTQVQVRDLDLQKDAFKSMGGPT